ADTETPGYRYGGQFSPVLQVLALRLLRRSFCLRSFSIRFLSGVITPAAASIRSSSSRRARKRLTDWLRSRMQVAVKPVGLCFSCTQLEVLFTCCPPLPDERTKLSSISSSRTPISAIFCRSQRFFSSLTANSGMLWRSPNFDYLYSALNLSSTCR